MAGAHLVLGNRRVLRDVHAEWWSGVGTLQARCDTAGKRRARHEGGPELVI
jgi:hypothetical protein